jgi:serpin B
MKDLLKNMGMSLAFDFKLADFSNLADGALCIDDVIHKTFIQVDANGTRAGAATKVGIVKSAISIEENKIVRLDRPFVYMIIDNVTNLPIFMGVTMEIEN